MTQHGIAIIGCGRIGIVHLQNAVAGGRMKVKWAVDADTCVDRTKDKLSSMGLGDDIRVTGVSNLDDVLSDPSVAGVVVCTPTPLHEEICVAAGKAGKAIFCEKPLSTSLESIKRMYDSAEASGRPFFCAFSRRFDPQLRRLHDLVRAGKLGKVRMIKSLSRDPVGMAPKEYLKTTGGVFLDSAVHDLDQTLWITGDTPEWVFASGHATSELYQECGDTDTSTAMIKFAGGCIGHVEVSRDVPAGYDQRVEVMGTEGVISSENQQDTYLQMRTEQGTVADPIITDFISRYGAAYKAEMEHFADILEGKCEPCVSRAEAEMVHKMCHACNRSLRTGEKVILT